MGSPTDKGGEREDRATRLAAALRANLRRRKSQARGRQADERRPQHPAETAEDGKGEAGPAGDHRR